MQDDSAQGMLPPEAAACAAMPWDTQQRPVADAAPDCKQAVRTSAAGTAESSGCIEVLAIAPEATEHAGDTQRRGTGGAGDSVGLHPGDGLAHVLLRERELLRRLEVAEAARAEQDALRTRAECAEAAQQETQRSCTREVVRTHILSLLWDMAAVFWRYCC